MFVCCLILAADCLAGELSTAAVFGDNMVLQRDKPAPVWGWDKPGRKVTVSFAGQSKSAIAGKDGKWMVLLNPLKLNAKSQTMTISGAEKIAIKGILVGDVWLCSGQSNMGRNVARSVIPKGMKWKYSTIRYWGAGKSEKYPLDRLKLAEPAAWSICADEESTRGCCAVGFFFARRVQQDVNVPIGVLWQAWAGSIISE